MSDAVSHLIFDVESIADGDLISRVRYSGEGLSPDEAIAKYQAERLEQTGSTFIPHTFQIPIAVVVAKVTSDFRLVDIKSLDEPEFRPHVITKYFWQGWEMYNMPQWVTFNGRSFDIPIMELSAFRYGISIPKWFDDSGYKSRRNRFSTHAHLDLQELLTNFGAARFNGGLNLAAQTLAKPGKMGLSGDQVQASYDAGGLKEISDYCRCDVLDTYFVFLRCMVLTGKLELDREIELVQETRDWIEKESETCQACADYMTQIGEWNNPWLAESEDANPESSAPDSAEPKSIESTSEDPATSGSANSDSSDGEAAKPDESKA